LSATKAPPAAVVIFGASGDLASRKLLPALRELWDQGLLDEDTHVVGVGRSELTDEQWDEVVDHGELGLRSEWVTGDYTDAATYQRLAERLADIGNRVYYLSVPPQLFAGIVSCLGEAGLSQPGPGGEFARVVIEKPFGTDLESSRELDRSLHAVLDESQLYRIDHYLGKETVQNILALRFANAIFEPIWNRRYVDSVQLTVAEAEGVGHRAGFYETAGALRDIIQNHALQVLAMVAMEPPVTMTAENIRDEKVKVLQAIDRLDVDEVGNEVVRGQYASYRSEEGVAPESQTETYVAARLRVDNWRWAGVPFFVRTGKKLPRRVTEVALRFKAVPHLPFASTQTRKLGPNTLVLRIQPDEGITLTFGAKVPGQTFDIRTVDMEMTWCEEFATEVPEAYQRLLHDALVGDPTLFIRSDEVLAAWEVVQPILDAWTSDDHGPVPYADDSWGPRDADRLLERDGHTWRQP
jgi:glucose-6-phosphate 1-dehydrogenase